LWVFPKSLENLRERNADLSVFRFWTGQQIRIALIICPLF
jgi:hypothetical protein